MENNELTPEKSLQIINEAIDKSRKDFEKNAGTPMIFWGAIVLLFSLAVWMLLMLTGKLEWNFLWFGIPVIGWPLYPLVVKGKCKSGGKSFISRSIGQIWLAYGIFATVLAGVFAFIAPHLTGYLPSKLGWGTFDLFFWSSTEFGPYNAWGIYSSNGTLGSGLKNNSGSVICFYSIK